MEIRSITSYRDGGTIHAIFHDGTEIFVDRRLHTPTPGALYAAYPREGLQQEPMSDVGGVLSEYLIAIMEARHAYKDARIDQRANLSTLEDLKQHRAADVVR